MAAPTTPPEPMPATVAGPTGPPWQIAVSGWPPGPNARLHGVERWRRAAPYRDAVAWLARALASDLRRAGWPVPLERARLSITYLCPVRRARDSDNLIAMSKPLIDGLVLGGLLAGDTSAHLTLGAVRWELAPRRAVLLSIAPLPEATVLP